MIQYNVQRAVVICLLGCVIIQMVGKHSVEATRRLLWPIGGGKFPRIPTTRGPDESSPVTRDRIIVLENFERYNGNYTVMVSTNRGSTYSIMRWNYDEFDDCYRYSHGFISDRNRHEFILRNERQKVGKNDLSRYQIEMMENMRVKVLEIYGSFDELTDECRATIPRGQSVFASPDDVPFDTYIGSSGPKKKPERCELPNAKEEIISSVTFNGRLVNDDVFCFDTCDRIIQVISQNTNVISESTLARSDGFITYAKDYSIRRFIFGRQVIEVNEEGNIYLKQKSRFVEDDERNIKCIRIRNEKTSMRSRVFC